MRETGRGRGSISGMGRVRQPFSPLRPEGFADHPQTSNTSQPCTYVAPNTGRRRSARTPPWDLLGGVNHWGRCRIHSIEGTARGGPLGRGIHATSSISVVPFTAATTGSTSTRPASTANTHGSVWGEGTHTDWQQTVLCGTRSTQITLRGQGGKKLGQVTLDNTEGKFLASLGKISLGGLGEQSWARLF